jgi:uncharacterized RDD family membrane protein YckC
MTPELNPYAPPAVASTDTLAPLEQETKRPAERGARLVACVVDWVLYVLAALPGVALIDTPKTETIGWIASFGGAAAMAAYQWNLVATRGQSPGKRLMKIRVVMLDGSPVTFGSGVATRIWGMAMIGAIPLVGGILRIVDPLMIFGAERRCLHDRLAGTKVIDVS